MMTFHCSTEVLTFKKHPIKEPKRGEISSLSLSPPNHHLPSLPSIHPAMFPSPLHLALTLATYTFALPLCTLSLTITHLLVRTISPSHLHSSSLSSPTFRSFILLFRFLKGLESNEERSSNNKIGVELVDNPGKPESSNANELGGRGSGARGMMERRFSSTVRFSSPSLLSSPLISLSHLGS